MYSGPFLLWTRHSGPIGPPPASSPTSCPSRCHPLDRCCRAMRCRLSHPRPHAGSRTEAPPSHLPSPLNNLAPRQLLSLLHSLKQPNSKRTPRPPSSSSDRLPPPLSSTIKGTPSATATCLTSHSPFLLSSVLRLLSHRARSAAAWSRHRLAASSLPSALHSIGEVPRDLLVS
jgi:hypothetical protein